jgi:hypothetical protein
LLAIVLLSTGILIFQPILKTGWSGLLGTITVQDINYTDSLNLKINENSNYTWFVENHGNINSIKLSGTLSSQGTAKAYILHENEKYLIFDSTQLSKESLKPITGAAVHEGLNETNETNQTIEINLTNQTKIITLNLEYKDNTEFDANNDGIETINEIIDFTVEETGFDWDVNYSNLCTKWEIFNQQSSTFVCYGAENCCNFIDLVPSSDNWNDSFNLNYGKYNANWNNTISAQGIYIDYSLDPEKAFLDIHYSDLDSLQAIFQPEFFSFEDICLETCILPNLNSTDYVLLFEIDNAILNINSISYTISELINITPIENITNITVVNETTTPYKVVINQPVKWIKKVKLKEKAPNLTVDIPTSSKNISVKKIEQKVKKNVEASIEVDDDITNIHTFNLIEDHTIYEEENSTIIFEEEVEEIEVEYYIEGPTAIEEQIDKYKKKIIINSDIHYEDILSYTILQTEAKVSDIHLYWLINNSKQEVEFIPSDNNGNGLIDQISWTIPYLSNQTYELEIIIIDAEHLDKDRTFIRNIYAEVNETDNITYTIPKKEFVRAYFKRNLTSENVIDIVVKNTKEAIIEIYEQDKDIIIGKLENITEGTYYISLNHTGLQSTFDMKSEDKEVIYDYIHDAKPAPLNSVSLSAPTTNQQTDTSGSFTMECTVSIGAGGAISPTIYFRIDENSNGCDTTDTLIPEIGTPGTIIYGDSTTQTTIACSNCNPTVTTTIYGYEIGGPYNICCHANDRGTNVLNPELITVEVIPPDTAAPNIEIVYPPNNTNISNNQITINYTVSDTNLDSCWYSNDTYTVNITLPNCENITLTWSEGQHDVTVWANDSANNQNSSSITFFVDLTPPSFTDITNISIYDNESLAYDINASDNRVEVDCFTVNNSNFKIDCSGLLENATTLSVGTYWLNITVNDTLNNINSIAINITVKKTPDLIPPLVGLIFPTNYQYKRTIVEFNCSMTDDKSGLKNSTLFGNWSDWHANETKLVTGTSNSTIFTKTITDGTYAWNCYVCDQENNCAFNSINYTFTVNSVPPYFTVIENISVYDNESLAYDINASDDIPGVDCFSLNDTTNFQINCSGYLENAATLSVGVYWLNITVNDTLNNMNSIIISVNVTIAPDFTPPYIKIVYPLNNTNTTNAQININYTASDIRLDTCWYSNDTYSFNYTLSNCNNITEITWSEGIHQVTVWANDTLGNKNSSSITFTIDTTPPYFTDIANISVYNDENIAYDIDASDSSSKVDCFTVNDTNFKIDCAGLLKNVTTLSVKTYWLNITVNDTLNNLNSILIYVNITRNQPPSPPTNIKCNKTNNCDISVFDTVILNASGSFDIDGDEITYFIEASLQNITTTDDKEPGTIQKTGTDGGIITNNVNLMFEDFETTTWDIIPDEDPASDCTSSFGNFNNCQDNSDYQFAKSSGGTAVSGTYMWVSDDWDTWAADAGIWYSFNPQTACNGYLCDDIIASGYGAASSLDDINEFCRVWARNDTSISYANIWYCGDGDLCEFSQDNNGIPSILGHWTYFETNFSTIGLNITSSNYAAVHIGAQGSGPHDQCYYDNINITGIYYTIAATNETNTFATTYENVDGNFSSINNITIKIEVDSYSPEASVQQTTNDPDLYLEIFNGVSWLSIGEFNLDLIYTAPNLDTTNYNFSLTTTEASILSAWQNMLNQDIRIRGVYMDYYNETIIDEINYTNIWIIINSKKWAEIGNHSEFGMFDWNTTYLPNQTCVNLRARAIDLLGNNTYSDYFTKNSCLNINHTPPDTTPPTITNARINDTSPVKLNTLVKVNATIIDAADHLDSVILEILPPISLPYNITPFQLGNEFYEYIVLDETGQWQFRFYANDTLGNNASLLAQDSINNYYIYCDGNAPSIVSNIKFPEPSYNNDDVTLSATITDAEGNLNVTWISGNWTGIWENYTNGITNIGSLYSYIVKAGNFSNQETVSWRYYANDSIGNLQQGALQQFTVQNRLPSNVTLLEPPNNTMTPERRVYFNWTDAFDLDGDPITYILQVDNDLDFSSLEIEKTGLIDSSYTLDPFEALSNGIYYWRVYSNDNYSTNISLIWQFEVNPSMGISIGFSDNLSTGVYWEIEEFPSYNISAIDNNGTGATGYDVAISTLGLLVDVYIKADGDLTTLGGDTIGLGNETFSYNLSNSSVPSEIKYKLTTNFSDNRIGDGLDAGSIIYLKFFLTVEDAAPGTYSNNINITAVPQGYLP